ncbi:MAG: NUDIX domain-containing protein [Clostridia bacterium]
MARDSKVWLGAAGIVIRGEEALVVKKSYGGLKGKWSFPAGFVQQGERVDQAAEREVLEETGITARALQAVAIRTGVIKEEISDNMVIFLMEYVSGEPIAQAGEIEIAQFLPLSEIMTSPLSTLYMKAILPGVLEMAPRLSGKDYPVDPIFGYTSYKIFS